jgi:hypothetical protein
MITAMNGASGRTFASRTHIDHHTRPATPPAAPPGIVFRDRGGLVFRTFGCCRGEGCHVLTGDTSCFGALVRDLLV